MNVDKPTKRDQKKLVDYKVKIQEYDNDLPPFLGNMLTIRLPITGEPKK